jgi:hypothetical protein
VGKIHRLIYSIIFIMAFIDSYKRGWQSCLSAVVFRVSGKQPPFCASSGVVKIRKTPFKDGEMQTALKKMFVIAKSRAAIVLFDR